MNDRVGTSCAAAVAAAVVAPSRLLRCPWGKGYRHPPAWHIQVPTGAQRAGQVCERSSRNICPLPWVQVLSLSPSFMFGVSLDSADHGGE